MRVAEKKHSGDNHAGAARSTPYGLSTIAPTMSLVDVAKEIEEADKLIGVATSSRLRVIADQIRHLQAEAQTILDDARRDLDLHRASCGFSRTPGQTYHLYRRGAGELYWSILSVEDWNGSPPHAYVGSYRLEPDQSWTAQEEIEVGKEDPFAGEAIVAALLPHRDDERR